MVSLSLLLSYLGYHGSWSLSHGQVYLSSPWKHRVPLRHLHTKLKHWDSRLEQAIPVSFISLASCCSEIGSRGLQRRKTDHVGQVHCLSQVGFWYEKKNKNWKITILLGLSEVSLDWFQSSACFIEEQNRFLKIFFCVVWRYHQCWRGKLGKDLDRSMLPCLNRVSWPAHLLNCVDSGKHVQEPSMKYG